MSAAYTPKTLTKNDWLLFERGDLHCGDGADERAMQDVEADMSRELNERYFREPGLAGPQFILTALRQFAEHAERAAADRPGKWTWHK